MNRIIFLVTWSTLLTAGCASDDDPTNDMALVNALTAGSSKAWNIYSEEPANSEPECRPTAEHIQDNAWIFFSNGDFEFDNGQVKGNQSCSDFINFGGTWVLSNNSLKVVATHGIDNPDITFDEEIILFGTIEELSETQLILTKGGHTVVFVPKDM